MLYKRMFASIILLFTLSTILMVFLFQHNQLWSAFFSSISAGCVTGIIFLMHQTLKGREARQLKMQVENHSQDCSQLIDINGKFRIHQRALINAEGDEFRHHHTELVKFANQFVRAFSKLASNYPKYYSDFVFISMQFKVMFSDVLDKVDWLESKLNEPPPDPIAKMTDISERMEFITIAHDIHCAFFEVSLKMVKAEDDIAKRRHSIDESII